MPDGMGGRVGRVQADGTAVLTMKENCIYLIRHCSSGLAKIGITENWERRSRQLKIGSKCQKIIVIKTDNNSNIEQELHSRFEDFRLPQSEWFYLSEKQIELLSTELKSCGTEIEMQSTKLKRQKTKPKPKTSYRFCEEKINSWEKLFNSSPYVSLASYWASDVTIFCQKVRRLYTGEHLLTPIGSISMCPDSGTPVFEFIKTHIPNGKSHKIHCQDEAELHDHIKSNDIKMRQHKNASLLLPVGTKIKWQFSCDFSMEDLFDELESYF